MKIFISTIDVTNIEEKINNLDANYTISKYREIYTNTNIYNIENNKIFKLSIEDNPIENITYNNLKILIDKSNIRKNEVSSIPFNFMDRDITIKKINYNNDKELYLVVKYLNNKVIDFYFESNYAIFDDYIKNKLFNLISLLFKNIVNFTI